MSARQDSSTRSADANATDHVALAEIATTTPTSTSTSITAQDKDKAMAKLTKDQDNSENSALVNEKCSAGRLSSRRTGSKQRSESESESCDVNDHDRMLPEQTKQVEQEQQDMALAPQAPDGGYAWWVLFGSFVCNLLVDGVVFAFGGIYEHLKLHFHATATEASLVGSLLCGCYLLMGPFTSVLCKRFGCRKITMSGAVFACVSFMISMFATDIQFLQLSLGVLGGIGFGLIYLPSIVIVGYWFDKKRALATGIAVCASSLGGFTLAPLCQILLNEYDWRGTTLILGGFVLNAAWAGALFRSVEEHWQAVERKQQCRSLQQNAKGKNEKASGRRSKIMTSVIREKERQRTESTHSLDNCVITGDNEIVKISIAPSHVDSLQLHQSTNDNSKTMTTINNLTVSDGQLHKIAEDVLRKQQRADFAKRATPMRQSSKSIGEEVPIPGTANNTLEVSNARYHSQSVSHGSRLGSDASKAMKDEFSRRRRDLSKSFTGSIAMPLGSVSSLATRRATVSCTHKVAQKESAWQKLSRLLEKVLRALNETFDVSLLKSPTFILIIVSSIMSMLGFFLPFMFITGNARNVGLPPSEATVMLMIMNIANAVGRVISGWMSDRSCVDVLWTNHLALILAGAATMCVPLCTTYVLLAAYSAIFGMLIAAFVTLRSILLVEVLGLDKLTNAFGWLILFQGIAVIFGPPVGGMFYDATQSYSTTFLFGGSVLTLSGAILIPLRKLSDWEKAKNSKNKSPAV